MAKENNIYKSNLKIEAPKIEKSFSSYASKINPYLVLNKKDEKYGLIKFEKKANSPSNNNVNVAENVEFQSKVIDLDENKNTFDKQNSCDSSNVIVQNPHVKILKKNKEELQATNNKDIKNDNVYTIINNYCSNNMLKSSGYLINSKDATLILDENMINKNLNNLTLGI